MKQVTNDLETISFLTFKPLSNLFTTTKTGQALAMMCYKNTYTQVEISSLGGVNYSHIMWLVSKGC